MDEIIELIEKYWRFDNNQQPMSSWHEKQDLIELLRSKQTGTNTLVSGSLPTTPVVQCKNCGTIHNNINRCPFCGNDR